MATPDPFDLNQFADPEQLAFDLGQFGAAPANKKTGMGDIGRSFKAGVQQLPGIAAGLADLVPALAFNARPVTQAANWMGEKTGFQPGQWAKDTSYSPGYNESQAAVNQAWQASDAVLADPATSKLDYAKSLLQSAPTIAGEYLSNPMYSANQVAASLPAMIAGGVASRGLMLAGAAPALAADAAAGTVAKAALPGYLERAVGEKWAAPVAGGIGEGAMQTGQQMDDYQGPDQRKGALAAIASGALDAVIAAGGGRLANRLGLETPETLMAKGLQPGADRARALPARLLGGAASEGLLQELPQSMQEQAWANYAAGDPLGKGVARAGVEGSIAGGVLGAAANLRGSPPRELTPAQQLGINPADGIVSRVATAALDQGIGALNVQQRQQQILARHNAQVIDGDEQRETFTGTELGDGVNDLGRPYTDPLQAITRARNEGEGWTVAPVFDGFVARRMEVNDGTGNGVLPGIGAGLPTGRSDGVPSLVFDPADDPSMGAEPGGLLAADLGEPGQLPGGVPGAAVAPGTTPQQPYNQLEDAAAAARAEIAATRAKWGLSEQIAADPQANAQADAPSPQTTPGADTSATNTLANASPNALAAPTLSQAKENEHGPQATQTIAPETRPPTQAGQDALPALSQARLGESANDVFAALKQHAGGVLDDRGTGIVPVVARVVGGGDYQLKPDGTLVKLTDGGMGERDATPAELADFHSELEGDRVQVLAMTRPGYGSGYETQSVLSELHNASGNSFSPQSAPPAAPAATSKATQPPSAPEAAANDLLPRAAAVYASHFKAMGEPTAGEDHATQLRRAQLGEQVANPERYHAVSEEPNPKDVRIGDRVQVQPQRKAQTKDATTPYVGTVVSIAKAPPAYQSGFMVKTQTDTGSAAWSDLGEVAKSDQPLGQAGATAATPTIPAAPVAPAAPELQVRIDAVLRQYHAAGQPDMAKVIEGAQKLSTPTLAHVEFWEKSQLENIANARLKVGVQNGTAAPVTPKLRSAEHLFETEHEKRGSKHVPQSMVDAVLAQANRYVEQAAQLGLQLDSIDSSYPAHIRDIKAKEHGLRGLFGRYLSQLKAVKLGHKNANAVALAATERELKAELALAASPAGAPASDKTDAAPTYAKNLRPGDEVEFTDHVGGIFHPGDKATVQLAGPKSVQFKRADGSSPWVSHETLDSGQPERWTRATPTPAPEPTPTAAALQLSAKELARVQRETESATFTDLVNSAELLGQSLQAISTALTARLPRSTPQTVAKMAQALQKQLLKKQAEIEKAKYRDPSLLQAVMVETLPENTAPEDAAQFNVGFLHALSGKTKSTLTGDKLALMQQGYDAARAWIKTDEGRAYYEGKPSAKLQNTGVDLRRHWELMQAEMKANESDIKKAWQAIERATNRANLFAPLLPDGVKPGFRLYVTEVRDRLMPFKKWLEDKTRWYGSTIWRHHRGKHKSHLDYILEGSRYPGELTVQDKQKFETDGAYRADYLRAKAQEYLTLAREYMGFLEGTLSVTQAATHFEAQFVVRGEMAYTHDGKENDYSWSLTPAANKLESKVLERNQHNLIRLRLSSAWAQALIEKEDTIALPSRATALTPPKLDRVTRSGLADHRQGANVTPEEFKAKFGFADVGFGDYVRSKQDQDHLNYAYDAFMDLAKHFGIAPGNIGMGLHFTIGALGHGKFSAHFQAQHPGPNGPVQVINLTNTRGDGTVYHEWIHALDYNLGGQWKSGSGHVRAAVLHALKYQALTTEALEQRAQSFLIGGTYWKSDKRGDKVQAAILGIERFRSSATAYKTNADALGEDYWGNDQELIARAGEAWAADTLGGEHSYLVNPDWVGDGRIGPAQGYRGTPYPSGEERKRFNRVYTALAKAIQWEDGKPTVSKADFLAALVDKDDAAIQARRAELLTKEGMTAFYERLRNQQEIRQNEKAEAQAAELRAEQAALDKLAAQKMAELAALDPPKPDTVQGPLSDRELEDLFDQAAAELRESRQEEPQAPTPGEPQASPSPEHDAWSVAELTELLEKAHDGDLVALGGGGGIPHVPTIHELGALGKTDMLGFGMFETTGADEHGQRWSINWSAGGAMNQLASGKPYTNVSYAGPGTAPWPSGVKRAIEAERDRVADKQRKPTNLKQANAARAEQAAPSTPPSAAALIADAARLGVKGIDESLKGLSALFGKPGRLNSFPAGFDEATYQQAKPHFQAALAAFQAAGKTLKDLFAMLIGHFGDGVKMYAIQFAKEQNLTANLGQQDAAVRSPSVKLAAMVQDWLNRGVTFTGQQLFDQADSAFGGTQAQGSYTPKDAYDAMEMGVNRYLLANPNAFSPNVNREQALVTVARLKQLTQLLATQTKRTAEMDEFQQFSTVPAFAFVANWVAGVRATDVMLEPSAGIGGLAVFARNAGATLVLNELSSRRADVLQEVFPSAQVLHENAEQLHHILPESIKPTVVVMNPPFSASAGRLEGERSTKLGAQHVEQALLRLEDGGRLVAVVGEGMTLDKSSFKAWWKRIQAKYDVRAVIPVDGKGYAKYGTTFSNALLVIDKVAPKGRTVVTTPASDYSELVGILAGIRNDRAATTRHPDRSAEQDGAESAHHEPVPPGEGGTGGGSGAGQPDHVGAKESGRARLPLDGAGGRLGGNAGNAGQPTVAVRGPGGARNGGGANAARGGHAGPEQPGGHHHPGPLPGSGLSVTGEQAQAGELTDSVFESYQPQRLQIPGAQPHPGPLVQSAAMASVLPPAASYTPNLPKETISKGKLSLAQLESVVYAGQAHQELLADKVDAKDAIKLKLKADTPYRRGFFIGDGTGVGKGREIGGIILDNLRQGRKKAIWISEKRPLIVDAKRDFLGVGGNPELLFDLSDTKASEPSVKHGDGILFTTYSTLKMGGTPQGSGKPATPAQLSKAYPPGTPVIARGDEGKIEGWDKNGALIDFGSHRSTMRFERISSVNGHSDWRDGDAVRARGADKKNKAGANQSRLEQIANWVGADYDGVIAFDESHNAGNATAIKGERGSSEPSQQALAMVDLQRRLPNARIVYVSATGATTVENLAYATRLGLWGTGTPFPSVQSFVAEMMAGGLATMELVARDMKQMGVYMARSLSFEGVSYGRLEHELTELQTDAYNRMAEAWQITLQHMDEAMALTGVTEEVNGRPVTRNSKAKGTAKAAYWGAQLRFFNQIITSMQMPTVLEQMEQDIAAGHALVLQLVNTNEAAQERAIEERQAADQEDDDLEGLDLTPKKQLLEMIRKSFPVVQMQAELDADGNRVSVPVRDAEGKLVQNREAVALRDKLMQDIEEMRVFPDGPLEMILNHFGVDTVAEVTGRKERIVRKPDQDGNIKAQLEKRGAHHNQADADAFLADKKRILIFSNAGGTGYSFHADLTKLNQRKRSHYLIQPGWRADKAVQGFGRSHRTNQKSAPHYWLASTNIPAHKRFLSAIARRLDMLGAMTKGQRDTANQGLFSEKDNLDSKYALQAVHQLITDVRGDQVAGLSWAQFTLETGLDNLVDPNTGQIADKNLPKTSQFLNRMLSLKLAMQEVVFNAFIARMEEKIDTAIARGEFESGMETIKALSTQVVSDEVIYTDPRSGADTRLVALALTLPNPMYPFPNAKTQGGKIEWLQNARSERVWAKVLSGTSTLKNGSTVDRFRMLGSGGTQILTADKFKVENGAAHFTPISAEQAQALWTQETEARAATVVKNSHMIVGALLPIWDRLKTNNAQLRVMRTQTEDGQRLLGRVVEAKDVPDIRKRLNIASPESRLVPTEVMRRILLGEVAELANGWKLARVTVAGDLRIEIGGLPSYELSGAAGRELLGAGVIKERIGWTERLFVPTGASGVAVLETIFKSKPLVELSNPNAPKADPAADAGGVLFSRSTGTSGGLPVQTVQGIVDAIRARWRNAPDMVVLQNMDDAAVPKEARAANAAQLSLGATGQPRAFMDGNTVYLLADQLASPNAVTQALLHETLGHAGLRGVFGEALKPILQQIIKFRQAEVEAKARQYGLDPSKPADRMEAAEEVLAELAQTHPEIGFVKRAVAAIRAWLRAHVPGFSKLALSHGEIIAQYLLPARSFIESGRGAAATGAMPRFSRSSEPKRGDSNPVVSKLASYAHQSGNVLKDFRGLGLQGLGRRQLTEMYAPDLPALTHYNRLVAAMDADKNESDARADTLATDWAHLKDERQLAELMHDATLAQIDPDQPFVEGDNQDFYDALKEGFAALSEAAQAMYRSTRELYADHHAAVRQAIRERIERAEMSPAKKQALLEKMDGEFFQPIKGVYFPLARFGPYLTIVQDETGAVVNVSRSETMNEAEATQATLVREFPASAGYRVGKVLRDIEFNAARDGVGRAFMEDLFETLEDQGAGQQLQDAISQLYLASLPDLSWAKHGIHRKGTPGHSQDARRAFAMNMFHGSRYLAKLRYADQLQEGLDTMQEQVRKQNRNPAFDSVRAQQVVDEMVKRHDSLMNPKTNPLAQKLTSFGFVFYLGLSPASAIVNLSQQILVGLPLMAAKWGFGKASKALLEASKQAASNSNDLSKVLTGDELQAYNEAVRAGVIDVTLAHDLAGVAQGSDAGPLHGGLNTVTKWASFLFHHAEKFNRQAAFMASYRLARSGSDHASAFDAAVQMTYQAHFDYAVSNRPRVMQGNVARVLLQFKQYAQNMIYVMSRNAYLALKAAQPGERAEARKALGGLLALHALGAGALGLPLVGTLLAAASMLGGDEDEPWDAEVALKNLLADSLGQKPAEVLAHGLSRLTPWDISGRVGLNTLLLPDVQEGLQGARLVEAWMSSLLGPSAGILLNAGRGLQSISEGQWGRGLEAMLPAVLRGAFKAYRFGSEGNIDKSGIVINDEVSMAGVLGQALGFAPSETRLAQEGRSAIYQADARIQGRRRSLLHEFSSAVLAQDDEGKAEAQAAIAHFNQVNPSSRITGLQLAQSVHQQRKRIAEAKDGVYLPRARRVQADMGRFATTE